MADRAEETAAPPFRPHGLAGAAGVFAVIRQEVSRFMTIPNNVAAIG